MLGEGGVRVGGEGKKRRGSEVREDRGRGELEGGVGGGEMQWG